MYLRRELLTSKQSKIIIESSDEKAIYHFLNEKNFADIVLDQINTDRFYDQYFNGKKDLTILDIGGNIGLFSLYVHDSAKVVYPIEPTPNHFYILKELTKNYPNIKPINVAANNNDTEIDFYFNDYNSTMNSLVNKTGTKTVVQAKTIKTIIDELGLEKVDFIKCDIEGSELVAITSETVGQVKDIVDSWFFEIHQTDNAPWPGNLSANREHIKKILEGAGYQVELIRHDAMFAKARKAFTKTLIELNEVNGADKLLDRVAKNCLREFNETLYGVEMGIAYGGGAQRLGHTWKGRGFVWAFDTFEGHPNSDMVARCPDTQAAGGMSSTAATCMQYWYDNKETYGVEKLKDDYIRTELDKFGLFNVMLVKGLVTDQLDLSAIPKLHYAFLDMDFPRAQWDGYLLVKDKIVSGGYLCLHDMIPNGHIPGCYEKYQQILDSGLWDLILEDKQSYLVILKRK
jgi:FkbM family methyltransferase